MKASSAWGITKSGTVCAEQIPEVKTSSPQMSFEKDERMFFIILVLNGMKPLQIYNFFVLQQKYETLKCRKKERHTPQKVRRSDSPS